MFEKLFGKKKKNRQAQAPNVPTPQKVTVRNPFHQVFGNVTVKMVHAEKKGLCLEASVENGTKILMEFYRNGFQEVVDGTNAYFFGNKLIVVTRWSDMSDAEKHKVETAELVLAIHPYQCAQLALKIGEKWGDVMVTLPHCYAELNDENAPVDEAIFLFADTEDPDYLTYRRVSLPTFIQKYLKRCNINSHKLLQYDKHIWYLQMEAKEDPKQDFYDLLYQMCWDATEKFYANAITKDLDNILDGVYVEIDSDNNVTDAYQHEYVEPVRMSGEVKLLTELAQKGIDEAQYNLGVCYEQGDGIDQDLKQAVYWYRKAADQGFARAQYNLGVCCYNGYGMEVDHVQAAQLFRAAAEQGHMNAQFNFAVCCFNGVGVEENVLQGTEWLMKAAEQGHPDAKRALQQD